MLIRKPKIIQSFVHNFVDDMGTTFHFLPWSDDTEEGNSTDGRWFYAMPFSSMRCLKVIMRMRALANPFNMDLVLGSLNDQDAVGATAFNSNTQYFSTISVAGTNNSSAVFETFNSTPVFTQTTEAGGVKMIGIRVQADLDPGSSNEWYFTSLWECVI